jgi:translation initiation factor 6
MLKMNFSEDPNIGLYGFATESYCILGDVRKKERLATENELGVKVHVLKLFNTDFSGIFCAGNSSGMLVPDLFMDEKLPEDEIKILRLAGDFNALGNLISMNDNGIILSPLLKNHRQEIKDFFGLPTETTTIAEKNITGNSCIATNRGCLVHMKADKKEIRIIEDVLGVESFPGTTNYGSPFVKAGVLANSRGFVASKRCSGPELGRITEALGFL